VGPYRLFGQAVTWLRRNRVLLPGVSVLARLVASVREGAAGRMYRSLADAAAAADPALPARLRACCWCRTGNASRNWSGCGPRRRGRAERGSAVR
jgi:hypothetical protein